MARVRVHDHRLEVGSRFTVRLERTLRVPNDGRSYPLPPSLGPFSLYRTRDYAATRPAAARAAYFAPLYRYEALWLSFEAADWKPNAVQVCAGGINVLTGERRGARLSANPQNYIVCPLQPWLDGIRTENGTVRQFVAAPRGTGLTLEQQMTGAEEELGLQLRVFEPRRGVFPERKPRGHDSYGMTSESPLAELGIAGGGAIVQSVYPDPHGVKVWDPNAFADVAILLVSSADFRAITGEAPPPSPVCAEDYTRAGLPWFELQDEDLGDIGTEPALADLQTVERHDPSLEISTVRKIRRKKRRPLTES